MVRKPAPTATAVPIAPSSGGVVSNEESAVLTVCHAAARCACLQNATTKGALTSFAWLVGNLLAFTTSEGWIRVSHVL